jgi:hypothetical protein
MKYQLHLIIPLIFPLLVLAQHNDSLSDDKLINYCKKVDSISFEIYTKNGLENLKYSYQYLDNIDEYKNVITTNYWANDINVNFVFKDDNLSYLTPTQFDKFRRDFYKDKKLNILVHIDNEEFEKHFFKSNASKNTFFKSENYITTTLYFKDLERFIIVEFYFEQDKLIKSKIRELNLQFQWDIVNYSEFYYKNSKLISQKFYQSLMDGRFGLDRKFSEPELIKMVPKLLENIREK